ncbi:MAG: RidA family protein [Candidatus Dormibacteria bacterium]
MASDGWRERLQALGLTLPVPPTAVAAYAPVTLAPIGDGRRLASVSGQLPMRDGKPQQVGAVPAEVSVEEAVEGARTCALNLLAQLEAAAGLDNVEQMLQLTVYVRSAPDFTAHPTVGDGASRLLVDVLGEKGRPARAAIGVASLPLGVAVEVSALALVR